PEERPLMASVYLNRLEEGMRLQADPTAQYAKGYDEETERWWSSMSREEFNTVDSPYNTYLNAGLPPGPICNPGLASLRAVLEPEPSDYLFFLARGDGSHVFAETYEEHLRNEERYGGE
ncbi:MAG: endolytic transglycosylase MltG, partial [Chloroflexota bacterium]